MKGDIFIREVGFIPIWRWKLVGDFLGEFVYDRSNYP